MESTTPIVRLTPYTDDPFGFVPIVPVAPPRLWTVWLMLPVAALVAAVTTALALLGLFFPVAAQLRAMALGPRRLFAALTAQPAGLFAAALAWGVALAGCALVAAALSPSAPSLAARLRLRECPRWPLLGLAGALTTAGVAHVGDGLAALAGVRGVLLGRAFTAMPVELAVLGALIAGVGVGAAEELFFRGYLQTRFEERVAPWAANVVVAVLFALSRGAVWPAAAALVAGLLYGWLARRVGSLLPSIAAHVLAATYAVLSMGRLGGGAKAVALGAAMMLAGVGALAWLTRRR